MPDAKISALPIASIAIGDPIPFTKISSSVTSATNFADFKAAVLSAPFSVMGVGVSSVTGDSKLVLSQNPTMANASVTGNMTVPVVVGTSFTASSSIVSTGKVEGAGIGYATGAGGTVTQSGTKNTSVLLTAATGKITMSNSVMSASVITSFLFRNSVLNVTDMLFVQHVGGGTIGAYHATASMVGGNMALIYVLNERNAALSEAPVIGFAVIKSAIA